MIIARKKKNYTQMCMSHDSSQGCQNQKQQVLLEVGRAGAHGGGAHVKVGLTDGRRSSFKQFDSRTPSTLEKDTT